MSLPCSAFSWKRLLWPGKGLAMPTLTILCPGFILAIGWLWYQSRLSLWIVSLEERELCCKNRKQHVRIRNIRDRAFCESLQIVSEKCKQQEKLKQSMGAASDHERISFFIPGTSVVASFWEREDAALLPFGKGKQSLQAREGRVMEVAHCAACGHQQSCSAPAFDKGPGKPADLWLTW